MRLDFPIELRIDREHTFAQFDYFPPELLALAGALGCGLDLHLSEGSWRTTPSSTEVAQTVECRLT